MSHFSIIIPSIRARLFDCRSSLFATFVLLSGLFAAGCSGSHDDEVGGTPPATVLQFRLQTLRPEIREIRESITGTGTIGAAQTSNIGVVTPGIVERVFVRVGDRVKKGQPLFQTRKNDYEISEQLARAELTAAEARAEQARLDYERAIDLLGKEFISQAQLDTAANSLKAAKAEAGVAEARLAQAAQRLADTTVRAPYDGVVTGRNADEGTYKSAQTFGADSSVLQLQEIKIVVAVVRVPEIYITRLSIGTPGDIFIGGMDGLFQAEIYAINDKVDMRSRTVEVRFGLANDDYRIKPGLFVQADIHPPERTAMLLEQDAILDRSGDPYVFLLEDGIAQARPVVLREYDPRKVEILSGLGEHESILVGPDLIRLTDGDLIPSIHDADR
ncbi:MAG: efflux RND transporter periplasmic adaptor subunit [Gammaproteobacteria bacterium]|nr:efflux RND transporter periplasmic adaptor subunit [Gammaproteobacteria bacterium]NNL46685.1 efflux RND transporter periplasmic adaptor subunit [Woeseiaceae bacterium]